MQYLRSTTLALAAALTIAACSPIDEPAPSPSASQGPVPVTVVVHDSFYLPDELIADFEASSGIDVTFTPAGDAGALVNQVALTAGAPLGDAVYGIDNTFASRAIESGAIAQVLPPSADAEITLGDALTAIDYSDVCFNIDLAAFPGDSPETFDDLIAPEQKGRISIPNPTTSSPGLALLLATYATYDDGWADYWRALRDNDVRITSSWSESYLVDFSAPNYGGDFPIVLSYASSPPAEIVDDKPTTRALLDTCFRQVEYAGVLDGAAQPDAALEVIEWMLSDEVQSALPEAMYVYPVSHTATIPESWSEFAPLAPRPITLPAETIDAVRDELLREWDSIMLGGA